MSNWNAREGYLDVVVVGIVAVVVDVAVVVGSRIRRGYPEACTSAWDLCGFVFLCIERIRLRPGRN